MNLLLRDFTEFTADGRQLNVLLSTMGNITRPEYLIHLRDIIPAIQLRVFHPPEIPFDDEPPNFHLKIHLFRHLDGNGSLLIGSSNFTEAGFIKNVEWIYFSPAEINLPFEELSPFDRALDAFNLYWGKASVEVTDDFLATYRRRFNRSEHIIPRGKQEVPEADALDLFEAQQSFSK
jgi:HKD family nuclease